LKEDGCPPQCRYKIIVDVKRVNCVNIHYIGNGELMFVHSEDIRVNHYKQAHRGVFSHGRQYLKYDDLVEDTTLRDKMLPLVQNQMQVVLDKGKGSGR